MVNGDRPTLGPNAGRKARKNVGARSALLRCARACPLHRKGANSTVNDRHLGNVGSMEFRFANHAIERLPALAAELVAGQPDVLYTWTSGGARAAAAATSTIPIVVGPVNEGTMAGLVSDFGHPAGNVTGMTLNNRQQHEKCLQLLKEAAPSTTRVGVLLNSLNPVWQTYPDVLAQAARALGVTLVRVEARGEAELDQAFAAMAAQRVDGLFGLGDGALVGNTPTLKRIVEPHYRTATAVSLRRNGLRQGGRAPVARPRFLAHRSRRRRVHPPHPPGRESG